MARKTKEEALETRERILEAALNIFAEKNYSDVSVTEIADYVGVSKGAVYWHFKNKSDILVRTIESACIKGESDFIDIAGAPKYLADLRSYYTDSLARPLIDMRCKKIHQLMLHRYEWPEDVQNIVTDMMKASMAKERKMLGTLILKAQEEGKIKKSVSSTVVAGLIAPIFDGLFILRMSDFLPNDFSKETEFLFDALVRELKDDDYNTKENAHNI